MFSKHDSRRNEWMLKGSFAKEGYDWWWHSFTAINESNGEEKPFFIEFFTCNPALGGDYPIQVLHIVLSQVNSSHPIPVSKEVLK